MNIPASANQYKISFVIPAHNEEANIANLLNNLLVQTGSSFTLEKIIVFCDGCTDKTADTADRQR